MTRMTDGIIDKVLIEVLIEDDPHTDTIITMIVTMKKFADRLKAEIEKELSVIDEREMSNPNRLTLLGEIWTKLLGNGEKK